MLRDKISATDNHCCSIPGHQRSSTAFRNPDIGDALKDVRRGQDTLDNSYDSFLTILNNPDGHTNTGGILVDAFIVGNVSQIKLPMIIIVGTFPPFLVGLPVVGGLIGGSHKPPGNVGGEDLSKGNFNRVEGL